MARLASLFEIVLVAVLGSVLARFGFVVLDISAEEMLSSVPLLFIFMISEATLTLGLIALLLKTHGEGFVKIGWKRPVDPPRETLIGLLALPVLFVSVAVTAVFFRLVLPQYVSTTNPLLDMVKTAGDLMLFLISSVYVGGIKEEIQRAFVLVRFEEHLGGIVPGLILWSVVFAAGHSIQGVDNAAGAGLLGLIFGLLFIWRRNLAAPMVAHAIYDVATLLLFWGLIKR